MLLRLFWSSWVDDRNQLGVTARVQRHELPKGASCTSPERIAAPLRVGDTCVRLTIARDSHQVLIVFTPTTAPVTPTMQG